MKNKLLGLIGMVASILLIGCVSHVSPMDLERMKLIGEACENNGGVQLFVVDYFHDPIEIRQVRCKNGAIFKAPFKEYME